MSKPDIEDSQTHADITAALSQDSKISLAGKCRRKAKHIGSAVSTSGEPTSDLRDRNEKHIKCLLEFDFSALH